MTHEMTSDVFQQTWNGIEIFTTSASAAVVTQTIIASLDVNDFASDLSDIFGFSGTLQKIAYAYI